MQRTLPPHTQDRTGNPQTIPEHKRLLHCVAPKSALPFQPGPTAEPSEDQLSEDTLETSVDETHADTYK